MIAIRECPDGLILPVHAQPGARRSGVLGEHGGALKVAVTAPPENGRANRALAEMLATVLNLKRSQVKVLSAASSREKRFLVSGITKQELEIRVARLLQT